MSRLVAPFLALAVLAAACEVGGAPSSAGQAQIIIASDLPSSAFGTNIQPVEQAIALAIRQKGSIAGFKLGYWPLDDSLAATASPVRGAKNIQRMVADGRVLGMIGPWTSGSAFAEIPVANLSNLAMVSPAASSICLTVMAPGGCDAKPDNLRKSGPNNFFRIEAIDSFEGRAMARYVATNLAVKRVAVLTEWGGGDGKQLIDEFARELGRDGGRLVLQQYFDAGTKDFTEFLNEAKTKGAEAVYALGYGEDRICSVRAQMTKALPGAYFLGTDGLNLLEADPSAPNCIKDAVDTDRMLATYIAVDVSGSTDPSVKTVVDAYRSAYPKTQGNNPFTFAAYDCARILISAIERAIQANHGAIPTRGQVVAAVAATNDFKGLTGTYSFDANGDATSPLMSLYEVRNGQWVFLQKLDASATGG
jgi:branched-chain amino acid transport system substrate-binding protein